MNEACARGFAGPPTGSSAERTEGQLHRRGSTDSSDSINFFGGFGVGSVAQPHHPSAPLGDLRLVGHDDHRSAFVVQVRKQPHDFFGGFGVKVARGLVREEEGRIGQQGSGDGHPLFLTARELVGSVVHAIRQAHPFEGSDRSGPPVTGLLGVQQGKFNIGQGGGAGEQFKRLEHEANFFVANAPPTLFVHPGNELAVELIRS